MVYVVRPGYKYFVYHIIDCDDIIQSIIQSMCYPSYLCSSNAQRATVFSLFNAQRATVFSLFNTLSHNKQGGEHLLQKILLRMAFYK